MFKEEEKGWSGRCMVRGKTMHNEITEGGVGQTMYSLEIYDENFKYFSKCTRNPLENFN